METPLELVMQAGYRVIESNLKEKQPNLWVRRVIGGVVDAHAACGRRVFMSV